MIWSFLTGLNYCVILGLENPMKNVQVHNLMCYCMTFCELHSFKTPLLQLLNLRTNNLEMILSLDNTKVTLSHGPQSIRMSLFNGGIMRTLCDFC